MKIRITMKCPDALDHAIDSMDDELLGMVADNEPDRDYILDSRKKDIREVCGIWFEHGECVTLEVDTEDETCRVLRARG